MTALNLTWLRDNIRDFRKHEAVIREVKREEQRYRDQPGYEPFRDTQDSPRGEENAESQT